MRASESTDPMLKSAWSAYTKQLGHYFTAIGGDMEAKKKAKLLSICGPSTYGLFHSLVVPQKADEYSCEYTSWRRSPRTTTRYCRLWFSTSSSTWWTWQPGEMLADYVTEVKKLSKFCEVKGALDEMLRDRLVWGIHVFSIAFVG